MGTYLRKDMVRAWYTDKEAINKVEENHKDPPVYISLGELYDVSGVEIFQVNSETKDAILESLKRTRGYTLKDDSACSEGDEDLLATFYEEHLHKSEEIRLVLEGSACYDIRDTDDEWIRIEISTGDLIVIPIGIYHRFTLGPHTYINGERYYVDQPDWICFNRPSDDMDCRKKYQEKLQSGHFRKQI